MKHGNSQNFLPLDVYTNAVYAMALCLSFRLSQAVFYQNG